MKPATALYGVANGTDPLLVAVPTFSVKSIQQSTPVSGATNTLTLMLTANYDLAAGSTVTIMGLTGSQTDDSQILPVTSSSSLLGTAGAWTQSSGALVLTAASGGTVSGTAYTVTFNLTNPATAQSSPVVSVAAALASSVGSIAQAAMTKPATELYGVAECTQPLLVVVPVSLQLYICPCQRATQACCRHESAWREIWDPNSPLPTLVEMAVQLPYALQDFTAALQQSFKTAVGETGGVESFRVQIKSIRTIQVAAISVTFSIRTPQDTRAGLNFARSDKAAEWRAALSLNGILNARLLAKDIKAFSLVLQEPVVVPPSAVTNYCTTVVAGVCIGTDQSIYIFSIIVV